MKTAPSYTDVKHLGCVMSGNRCGNCSAKLIEYGQVEGLDGVKIVHVSAGLHHSLAVSDKGELFSWGWGGSTMPGSTVGALGHGCT